VRSELAKESSAGAMLVQKLGIPNLRSGTLTLMYIYIYVFLIYFFPKSLAIAINLLKSELNMKYASILSPEMDPFLPEMDPISGNRSDPNSVLKTTEPKPKPAGLTGLIVDRFKPVNKRTGRPVWS
jgi:hypothetical protein